MRLFLNEKEQISEDFFAVVQDTACKQLLAGQIGGREFAIRIRAEDDRMDARIEVAFQRMKQSLSDDGRAALELALAGIAVNGGDTDPVETFDKYPEQLTQNFIMSCKRIGEQMDLR